MTFHTMFLRALAAVIAGVACQVVHADYSPVLALVTGQPMPDDATSDGGPAEQEALQSVNPSLSLLPESQIVFPQELILGEYERRGTIIVYDPLMLGDRRDFAAREKFITSSPSIFDVVGDYFSGDDIEWPTGTQESVFVLPTPLRGSNKVIPFVDLLQDADEIDAHLRMGIGVGLKYLIAKDMTIDAEVMALDTAGDHNPANSSETRLTLIWTVRF